MLFSFLSHILTCRWDIYILVFILVKTILICKSKFPTYRRECWEIIGNVMSISMSWSTNWEWIQGGILGFFFLRKAAHYQNQVSAPQTSACTSVTLASCSDGCGCGRRSAAKPRVLRSRQAQVPLVQLVQATLGSKAVGDGLQVGLTLVSQDTLKLNDLLCTEEVVVLQFVIWDYSLSKHWRVGSTSSRQPFKPESGRLLLRSGY